MGLGRQAHFSVLRPRSDRNTLKGVRTISLRLPDKLLGEVENEAQRRRVSKSTLIRESIEEVLRKRERPSVDASCYDLARDLAGSVRGLPKDIATNPKHMRVREVSRGLAVLDTGP